MCTKTHHTYTPEKESFKSISVLEHVIDTSHAQVQMVILGAVQLVRHSIEQAVPIAVHLHHVQAWWRGGEGEGAERASRHTHRPTHTHSLTHTHTHRCSSCDRPKKFPEIGLLAAAAAPAPADVVGAPAAAAASASLLLLQVCAIWAHCLWFASSLWCCKDPRDEKTHYLSKAVSRNKLWTLKKHKSSSSSQSKKVSSCMCQENVSLF